MRGSQPSHWSDIWSFTIVDVLSTIEDSSRPKSYVLNQNYPNPFNPVTTLRFDLPRGGDVSLVVYDMLGREVTRLMDAFMMAGQQKVQWDGGQLPSGVYFARLETPGYRKTIKMVLLK